MTKNKNKKTLFAFLLGIVAVYSIWTAIQNISTEFKLPLPILVIIILIAYLLWSDKDISE